MLKSMTGFGRGIASHEGIQVVVEMRTVNHRYAEVNVRTPKEWMRLEDPIKKYVLSKISRGRADITVTIKQSTTLGSNVSVNEPLATQAYHALLRLASTLNQRTDSLLQHVIQIPGVLVSEEAEVDEQQVMQVIMDALEQACEGVLAMRSQEGETLLRDLKNRLHDLEQLLLQIEQFAPDVVFAYRERLLQRVQEAVGDMGLDEQRLLTEIVVYTDRTDIQEEIVRLHSHIQQFRAFTAETDPIGRKMDFLIQEMNREVNTIGSKANHAGIASCVVECKTKLEQMREQIQNIE